MTQTIIQATPSLAHLTNDLLVDSFCPEGFIDIGVSIGTDDFIQSFVAKTYRDIIDDVEKLDAIQDGFVHFQVLRCPGEHFLPQRREVRCLGCRLAAFYACALCVGLGRGKGAVLFHPPHIFELLTEQR